MKDEKGGCGKQVAWAKNSVCLDSSKQVGGVEARTDSVWH